MEHQEIIEEEETNPHESSSSSLSTSSSSPSHTQSFASSPSSQKETSAPSSASGSSSSSSSPFSEPSSPLPNIAIDHASTSSIAGIYQYSNANSSLEEAHHHVDDDNGTLRDPSMVEEESQPTISPGRVSTCELSENEEMNSIHTGLNGPEPCNRSAVCTGSAECGIDVNTVACCETTHTNSISENHTNTTLTDSTTENHVTMESMGDVLVLEEQKAKEDQENGYNTSKQEHMSLGADSLINRVCTPVENEHDDVERSAMAGKDMRTNDICDVDKSQNMAEVNDIDLRGDRTYDTSLCAPELEKRVGSSSSQADIALEDGSDFSKNVKMQNTSDESPKKPLDLDGNDATAIQRYLKLKESNVAVFPGNMTISPDQAPPEINGLKRAQTMPTGNFEVVDGIVRSRKKEDFKRSITDKYNRGKDTTGLSPGSKMSRRKQKLVKRICKIQKDGTVEFDADKSTELVPDLFSTSSYEDSSHDEEDVNSLTRLPLQIAMLIVGTRGDVQPFVAIGKRLQEYGHRVRLATHANFEEFVLQAGLEFYPLGGDPKVLAKYMVKNKGFLPSGTSEIRIQRKQLKSIINSLLPACTCPDKSNVPFKVQAIIANPPAYGHVHVAEYLNVPLHIFFTMPWTPTSEFPHPLSRVHHNAANRISYQVVDSLIWIGIQGLINDFRKKKLKLRPITYLSGSQLSVSKLPTGYIWSPHLVPKPKDWGSKIDVVGFCFLDLLQDYQPPQGLVQWLEAGPPPIYVGFGSLPVEDAAGMTKIIVEALEITCQRGIIGRGWSGLGTLVKLPDSIYLLDNCPHDWLFSQCAAVVHHGGAGTTAAGLRAACPTTIVPFFGDQPFWGDRVYAKGVGPPPIPVDEFSLNKLVYAIRYMMNPQVKQNAIALAEVMKGEDGVEGAVAAFHKHLPHIMPTATELNAPKRPSNSFYGHLSCCF